MQPPSRYPLLSEAQWRAIFHLPSELVAASETAEQQRPDAEIARLQRELAHAQAEIKRLRTPPPKAQGGLAPTDALP